MIVALGSNRRESNRSSSARASGRVGESNSGVRRATHLHGSHAFRRDAISHADGAGRIAGRLVVSHADSELGVCGRSERRRGVFGGAGESDEMKLKRGQRRGRGDGQEHEQERWPLDPQESSNLSLSPDAREAGHTSTESHSSGEEASVGTPDGFSDYSDSESEAQRLLTTDDNQLVLLSFSIHVLYIPQ